MLYIEKKAAPRTVNTRVAEIKSSPRWREIDPQDTAALRALFDELPKDDLRISMQEEQHGLCAYCMARLNGDGTHTTIEHWSPLSKDKDNTLDYNNFLLVCKGGGDVSRDSFTGKRILCCDASKGDQEIQLDPRDREMMSHIAYKKDGLIEFHPSAEVTRWNQESKERLNRELNEVLCLNGKLEKNGSRTDSATQVIKGRRDAWTAGENIIQRLKDKKLYSSAQIRKHIEALRSAQLREPFVGVTIFYLERAYRKRKAMEENR